MPGRVARAFSDPDLSPSGRWIDAPGGVTKLTGMSPRRAGFLAFLSLLAGPWVRAETAPIDAAALMRAAVQSAQAGDFTAAVAGMEAAVAQLPGHPAYLYNLACMQAWPGYPSRP